MEVDVSYIFFVIFHFHISSFCALFQPAAMINKEDLNKPIA